MLPESNALLLLQAAVHSGDFQRLVRNQGDVHVAQTALLARRVHPGRN
jgi:hypothetical protein